MGLMRQYVGKYVTATSASTKIDATAIIKGCNAVDNDANEISRLANLFKSEAARIDKTSLSIDNKTMEENVDECSAGIEERRKAILDATDYTQLPSKTYNMTVELADTQDVVLTLMPEFKSQKVYTIYVIGNPPDLSSIQSLDGSTFVRFK